MKKSELRKIIREVIEEQMGGRMTIQQKAEGLVKTLGYPTSAEEFIERYTFIYRELQREPVCVGIPTPEEVRKIVMSEKMMNESPQAQAIKWAVRIIVGVTTTLCGWLWGEVQGWWNSWRPTQGADKLQMRRN
jgi:hypothetical protein